MITISTTARQSGFGTYPHKTVSHLTVDEKSTARVGWLVAYDCGRLSGGNHGTTWRVVRFMSNRFVPRTPSLEQLEQIVAAL